jgi:hypothetical protein
MAGYLTQEQERQLLFGLVIALLLYIIYDKWDLICETYWGSSRDGMKGKYSKNKSKLKFKKLKKKEGFDIKQELNSVEKNLKTFYTKMKNKL